ncbi:MAG: NUDIX domain-containing protein [Candidatus Woesearchaeota archaeon]
MEKPVVNLPGIGVAVVVFKDGKILLGEDLGKGKEVVFGVPGGHWDHGETIAEAARREVFEEAGIKIKNLKLISVYDFFREDKNKNYVSIGFRAEYESGDLKDESELTRKNWQWFDFVELPNNLFGPDNVLLSRVENSIIWEEKQENNQNIQP